MNTCSLCDQPAAWRLRLVEGGALLVCRDCFMDSTRPAAVLAESVRLRPQPELKLLGGS